MGKRFKKVLVLILSIIFAMGLYACGSKGQSASPAASKDSTSTSSQYTKEEVKELQQSPEKLLKEYYNMKTLLGKSDTPDKNVISKFYSLITMAAAVPMSYKNEEEYASQLTSNLKDFYRQSGKLLDVKMDPAVNLDDGAVQISVTEHYEKFDAPNNYKFIKKDDLWYLTY